MRRIRSTLLLAAWLAFTAGLAPTSRGAGDEMLAVSDAWVGFVGPKTPVHAGYLTITNRGAKARVVVAAHSPAYSQVHLHRSRVVDGVAVMEPVQKAEVPAGGALIFAPGGLHLMLMRPKDAAVEGSRVEIILEFQNGEEVTFAATLKRAVGRGHHDHGGMGKTM